MKLFKRRGVATFSEQDLRDALRDFLDEMEEYEEADTIPPKDEFGKLSSKYRVVLMANDTWQAQVLLDKKWHGFCRKGWVWHATDRILEYCSFTKREDAVKAVYTRMAADGVLKEDL